MVQGASMEPTFYTGDYLVVDEVTYLFREPVRGEIVVFRNPANPEEFYIKRIIGLPGETVDIRGDELLIDGIEVGEDYLPSGAGIRGEFKTELDDNHYYVMGDNRLRSSDSRDWGPLSREAIIGTVRLRFWPLGHIELFKLADA